MLLVAKITRTTGCTRTEDQGTLNLDDLDICLHTHSQMKFTLGREYTNESLRFRMPAGQYACDMGYFTIWCRQANQFFTRIRIPGDLFVRQ